MHVLYINALWDGKKHGWNDKGHHHSLLLQVLVKPMFTCFCNTGTTCCKAGMNCKHMPYSYDKPSAVWIVAIEKNTINMKCNEVNDNFVSTFV